MAKKVTTMRLSDECVNKLRELSIHLGISTASVVEIITREKYEQITSKKS